MMSWQSSKWITLIIYQQGQIILEREQNPELTLFITPRQKALQLRISKTQIKHMERVFKMPTEMYRSYRAPDWLHITSFI